MGLEVSFFLTSFIICNFSGRVFDEITFNLFISLHFAILFIVWFDAPHSEGFVRFFVWFIKLDR